jgi:hypothetical protein
VRQSLDLATIFKMVGLAYEHQPQHESVGTSR